MKADKILNQIIEKGSMLGTCAEYLKDDQEKQKLFLMECSEMCRNEMFKEFWGPELSKAIKNYCKAESTKNMLKGGFNRDIIETIKDLRQKKWPKQGELAKIIGMTQGNYSRLERGLIPLTFTQFETISKALNISISEIFTLALNRKYIRENGCILTEYALHE